jgi:uncharacterized protein YbaA (DUF1428 family)
MSYVMGFVTPVENGRRDDYVESARAAWPLFAEYGAIEQVECWGEAVPAGTRTDFRRAVDLQEGEVVAFSWVRWPDKASADACEAAMATDERFAALTMPFDGARMIYGGFASIFEGRRGD